MANRTYCAGSLAFLAGTLVNMCATAPMVSGSVYALGSVAFLVGTLLNMRRK